ncbi:MAG: GNAT family N-acetyltransferase [Candidatus Helarchaeota archaeon]
MSEDIIIRLFTDKDLDSVVEVNKTSLPENYAPYFFLEIFYKYPKGFWVAEDPKNGKIIGYCMWRIEKTFSYFKRSFRRIRNAHLISIAVLEDYRRRKIGERLLKKGMEAMRIYYHAEEYYLEVRISNESAIKLYEKNNFKKIKVINGYYKDGEDAYLMARGIENINYGIENIN